MYRTTPTIRNLQNYIRTCALANMHRWCVSTNYVVRRHQAFPNLDDYTTNWMGPPRYPHLAKLAKDIHTYSISWRREKTASLMKTGEKSSAVCCTREYSSGYVGSTRYHASSACYLATYSCIIAVLHTCITSTTTSNGVNLSGIIRAIESFCIGGCQSKNVKIKII